MFTAKCDAASRGPWDEAPRSMHTSTSGGTRLTELNAFTVIPWSRPSPSRTVTIVTPVANRPRTLRNVSGSSGTLSGRLGRRHGRRGAHASKHPRQRETHQKPGTEYLARGHEVAGDSHDRVCHGRTQGK